MNGQVEKELETYQRSIRFRELCRAKLDAAELVEEANRDGMKLVALDYVLEQIMRKESVKLGGIVDKVSLEFESLLQMLSTDPVKVHLDTLKTTNTDILLAESANVQELRYGPMFADFDISHSVHHWCLFRLSGNLSKRNGVVLADGRRIRYHGSKHWNISVATWNMWTRCASRKFQWCLVTGAGLVATYGTIWLGPFMVRQQSVMHLGTISNHPCRRGTTIRPNGPSVCRKFVHHVKPSLNCRCTRHSRSTRLGSFRTRRQATVSSSRQNGSRRATTTMGIWQLAFAQSN